jgi:hypothetical protein
MRPLERGVTRHVCLELPDGYRIDFESMEALALAMQKVREGQPIVIKCEDGSEEVLWAPED